MALAQEPNSEPSSLPCSPACLQACLPASRHVVAYTSRRSSCHCSEPNASTSPVVFTSLPHTEYHFHFSIQQCNAPDSDPRYFLPPCPVCPAHSELQQSAPGAQWHADRLPPTWSCRVCINNARPSKAPIVGARRQPNLASLLAGTPHSPKTAAWRGARGKRKHCDCMSPPTTHRHAHPEGRAASTHHSVHSHCALSVVSSRLVSQCLVLRPQLPRSKTGVATNDAISGFPPQNYPLTPWRGHGRMEHASGERGQLPA